MEKMHTGSDGGHPMGKKRFRFTFYSAAVLIVILIAALRPGAGGESVLFDKNSPITLYVKTDAGEKPEFDAAEYFPEAELDTAKFSFDWTDCDPDTPGTYTVPVFYDGKRTVCVVSLEVRPKDEKQDLSSQKQQEQTGGEGGSVGSGIDGTGDKTELRTMTGGESTEER